MKLNEAQYLNKISSDALKLNELYQKAITISRWITNKSKKKVTGWQISIEPKGIEYNYRNSISILIPRNIGIKEIRALADILKKQAKKQLDELKIDPKMISDIHD